MNIQKSTSLIHKLKLKFIKKLILKINSSHLIEYYFKSIIKRTQI